MQVGGGPEVVRYLTGNTPVCAGCWKEVWFQYVFVFRNDVKMELPEAVRGRGDCWYGINCRTMLHRLEHAKR